MKHPSVWGQKCSLQELWETFSRYFYTPYAVVSHNRAPEKMHGYFCILKNWYFCSSSYLLILISSLKLQFFCNHFLTKPYRLRTGHRHHQLLNSPYTAPSGSIVATCQCDDIAERCGVTTDQPWFFDSSMCLNLGIQPSKWPLEGPRDEKWIYFGSHFVDIPIDGDVSVFNKIVLPPWRAKVERAKCAGRLIFPWLLDVPTHATHCKSALAGLSTQSQHQHEAGCVNYYWCWECLHVITSYNHRRYRSHRTAVFSTCYFFGAFTHPILMISSHDENGHGRLARSPRQVRRHIAEKNGCWLPPSENGKAYAQHLYLCVYIYISCIYI